MLSNGFRAAATQNRVTAGMIPVGRDPRSLGGNSVAARAMNLTAAQTSALQEIAYRQLLASQAP